MNLKTLRIALFLATLCLVSSAAPATRIFDANDPMSLDAAPTHQNFWSAFTFGFPVSALSTWVTLALASKSAVAASAGSGLLYVATYAATSLADGHYRALPYNKISDEELAKALANPEEIRTSYLYCKDYSSSKRTWALDDAGRRVEVKGRWIKSESTYGADWFASIMEFGWNVASWVQTGNASSYAFLVEKDAYEGLRERCAATLGVPAHKVGVAVKNTDFTTKRFGYVVFPYDSKDNARVSLSRFVS